MRLISLIRGCFTFIGVLSVLSLLAIAVAYYMGSLTPPLADEMAPVSLSAEAVDSLNQKLAALQTQVDAASKAGEERQVFLAFTDDEINSKLVERLVEQESWIKDILINFRDDDILRYWVLDTPVFKMRVAARTLMEVNEGKPRLVIQEVNLGKAPLPSILSDALGEIMARTSELPTEWVLVPSDINWQVKSIQSKDGGVTITGLSVKGKAR